mmetsp:Transcript_12450/g.18144  ORF Transcript_12450/g.18144 Transcript_12450/m.18144 type:complete len:228 (-) Transcript_12450:822-1505(-)
MKWYHKKLFKLLEYAQKPYHLAFIMDGNRRWAVKSGKKKPEGHRYGLDKLVEVLEWCLEIGVQVISVFAFSIDNFKRPKEEVDELMSLVLKACSRLKQETAVVQEKGVRIKVAGDIHKFPLEQQEALKDLEDSTAKHTGCTLYLCLGYGGLEDVQAASKVTSGDLLEHLQVPHQVDLLVRTGESRLSNFLLYQVNQSTKFLMLKNLLWPEMTAWNFFWIIFKYQHML